MGLCIISPVTTVIALSVVVPAKLWPISSVMPTCVVGDGGPDAVGDGERHNTKHR